MSDQITPLFIEALRTLEQNRDVEPLVALYAPDAVAGNVVAPDHFHGPDGAHRFWSEYRGAFKTLMSSFRNVIVTDDRAALEWMTVGTAFDDAPVQYSGVTVLEFRDGKITRSTAYFDPKGLGQQVEAKFALHR
jgi:ketosteroid isomerase-like protein